MTPEWKAHCVEETFAGIGDANGTGRFAVDGGGTGGGMHEGRGRALFSEGFSSGGAYGYCDERGDGDGIGSSSRGKGFCK